MSGDVLVGETPRLSPLVSQSLSSGAVSLLSPNGERDVFVRTESSIHQLQGVDDGECGRKERDAELWESMSEIDDLWSQLSEDVSRGTVF